MNGIEGANKARTTLSTVEKASITLTNAGRVTLQAVLNASPTYQVHFLVSRAAATPASTPTLAELEPSRCCSHLGSFDVNCPVGTVYVHCVVTTSTGTVAQGSSGDWIYQSRDLI